MSASQRYDPCEVGPALMRPDGREPGLSGGRAVEWLPGVEDAALSWEAWLR